jgi:hypothetical protein
MFKSLLIALSLTAAMACGLLLFDTPERDKFTDDVQLVLAGITREYGEMMRSNEFSSLSSRAASGSHRPAASVSRGVEAAGEIAFATADSAHEGCHPFPW